MNAVLREHGSAPATVIPIATHNATETSYLPEESPFTTLFVDLTHRCNMACRNCYIPNRDIPDMPSEWLYAVLARLPRRTRIRLVGAEPTMRKDLPEIIARVRALGHLPIVMTNGLKLRSRGYVRRLKAAGMRTVHLSMNGGLDDRLYLEIDSMSCAEAKLAALRNLCSEHVFVTAGMILVRGVNTHHIADFWRHLRQNREVREVHFRNVGAGGRYMESDSLTLREMRDTVLDSINGDCLRARIEYRGARNCDIVLDGCKIAITEWPELGSRWRGRVTPAGTVEPAFEHFIANAALGGY